METRSRGTRNGPGANIERGLNRGAGHELMDQYLGDRDPTLKAWLLSRVATEAIIELIPTHLTSWDFRNRMTAAG